MYGCALLVSSTNHLAPKRRYALNEGLEDDLQECGGKKAEQNVAPIACIYKWNKRRNCLD